MPLKEFLIKRLSLKLKIPESTISIIINEQFADAIKATSSSNSIEISGFGKFLFNMKKANKLMLTYERTKAKYESILNDPNTSEGDMRIYDSRLKSVLSAMERLTLKLKTNETK
jgi:nucleoid DNA-binding protein